MDGKTNNMNNKIMKDEIKARVISTVIIHALNELKHTERLRLVTAAVSPRTSEVKVQARLEMLKLFTTAAFNSFEEVRAKLGMTPLQIECRDHSELSKEEIVWVMTTVIDHIENLALTDAVPDCKIKLSFLTF